MYTCPRAAMQSTQVKVLGTTSFVLCLLLTALHNDFTDGLVYCPPPPSFDLSTVTYTNTTSGSDAVYSCLVGYVLDNGDSEVTYTCLDTGQWDGPGVNCTPVDCGIPPSYNNTEYDFLGTTYQEMANYTCVEGYLAPEEYIEATCEASGNWTTINMNCQPIDCGPPPVLNNVFNVSYPNETGYLAQAVYQAYTGHSYSYHGARITFTCRGINNVARWSGYITDKNVAFPRANFRGCRQIDGLTPIGNYGRSTCESECSVQDFAYAAVKGSECACINYYKTYQQRSYLDCTLECGSELCGGEPNLWSIFDGFRGCYGNINMTTADSFLAYTPNACIQYCKGLDYRYAGYHHLKCRCLNNTIPEAVTSQNCTISFNHLEDHAEITVLETVGPATDTCPKLYKLGVHINSLYYLQNQPTKTMCHFYDGTVCNDSYWTGFEGSCYWWNTNPLTYASAVDTCALKDSVMLTLHSLPEAVFVNLTNNAITPFRELNDFFTGLYDHFGAFARQWSDGTLVTYNGFPNTEPNELNKKCTSFNRTLIWTDALCTSYMNSICKRPEGLYGCVRMPTADVVSDYGFTDDEYMTLLRCFEACRGQNLTYSVVSGIECFCMESLPTSHVKIPWTECATHACPGDEYQLCGDPSTTSSGNLTAFVIEDTTQPVAGSCLDLELQGMVGENLTISQDGVVEVANCTPEVVCPYTWGDVNQRCYKYLPTRQLNPYIVCGTLFNTYPLVIDNSYELLSVFNDSTSLRGNERWTLGIFKYKNIGPFRTSNGRPLLEIPQPESTGNFTCVSYNVTSGNISGSDCMNEAFICEDGPEYVGCVSGSPNDMLILNNYEELNIIQCVELCRGQGAPFALLGNNPYKCYCSNEWQEHNKTLTCDVFCYPDTAQLCGGAGGALSAYRIEAFPVFANKCADLFEEGVLAPGQYIINDEPQWCTMKDNTTCSPANLTTWIGAGLNGSCFKLSFGSSLHTAANSTCRAIGAPHKPASIRSWEELDLLETIYWSLKTAHTLFTIGVGAVDEFKMGAFTWADGWLVDFIPWSTNYPLTTYNSGEDYYVELNSTMGLMNKMAGTNARRLLCREVTDFLGCYGPLPYSPVIANYSSMGVTLCKQTCLGHNKTVALLDVENCYCVVEADLAVLSSVAETTAGCDVPCPANSMQSCANNGYLRAYQVDSNDVAGNCSMLHANFVVLENTYMLRNNDTGENEWKTCGFGDNTSCHPGYIGHNGKCYRFFPYTNRNPISAAQHCAGVNGYLATPRDQEEIDFIVRIIKGIPSLSVFSQWRLGILDLMAGPYQPASDGSMMHAQFWNGTRYAVSGECSTLDVEGRRWMKDNCAQLPFVCEHSPVFVGCKEISPAPTPTFDLQSTSSSVTQCVAMCDASNARYAVVTDTFCDCLTEVEYQAKTVTTGTCPALCDDYYTNVCGRDAALSYAVYDVNAYPIEDKRARSCLEYRQYLVTANTYYNIRVNGTNGIETLRVLCNDLGPKHKNIIAADGATATASSGPGYPAMLNTAIFPWTNWIRGSTGDTAPWNQMKLGDYYIIKAITVTGASSATDLSYVTTFKFSHGLFEAGLTQHPETFTGPTTRSDLVTHFLPEPIVTKYVRVHPLTWEKSPALAFTVLGQKYREFNHSDWYVGCFANPENKLLTNFAAADTFEECLNHCLIQRYPFFGLVLSDVENSTCACASAIGEYGALGEDSCSVTCLPYNNSVCGTSVNMSVAIYRTYEKRCPEPPFVANTTNSTNYLVTWPGVYTFGTNITYTCLTGHEFPDLSTVASITCLQNNSWSWLSYESCQIITCPTPQIQTHADLMYSSANYGDQLTCFCHNNYIAPSGDSVVESTCTATRVWDPPIPICRSESDFRSRLGCKTKLGKSLIGTSVVSVRARSLTDCVRFCLISKACGAYSFPKNASFPAGDDNCRMHVGFLTYPTYEVDENWNAYTLGQTC